GDDAYDERIYIGEAENIKARLRQHLSDSNKDFNEFIFFISKDELLTKTQIRYLESRMIQLAVEAKSAEIENNTSPRLPTLHEADISDMEYFLEQIKLVLPVMGFKFLISSTVRKTSPENATDSDPVHQKYLIKTSTYSAQMIETDQGYIVLKGSQAKKGLSKSTTETYRKLRRKLLETEILVDDGDKLIFAEDAVFNSPSAASNMVLGRNSNGYSEWIDDQGRTFKQVQDLINQ
ncbi:MAG: GIY-YIG nuclease family protein, partial [Gracilimonas sp.]|nr:GIY-YIG nuclease family protein [Gracilimonas sp.]